MKGYNIEHTPTESSAGGTLIYIRDNLNYKVRKDLIMHKEKLLESSFIEILMKT